MWTLQHLARPWKLVCAAFFVIAAVFTALFVLAIFSHRFIPAMVCAAVAGIALITAFNMLTPTAEQQLLIASNQTRAGDGRAEASTEKVIAYVLLTGGGVLTIAFIAVLLHGLLLLAAALAGFIIGCMVSTWCVFRFIQARKEHERFDVRKS